MEAEEDQPLVITQVVMGVTRVVMRARVGVISMEEEGAPRLKEGTTLEPRLLTTTGTGMRMMIVT